MFHNTLSATSLPPVLTIVFFSLFAVCALIYSVLKTKAYEEMERLGKAPPETWLGRVYDFKFWAYARHLSESVDDSSLHKWVMLHRVIFWVGMVFAGLFALSSKLWLNSP